MDPVREFILRKGKHVYIIRCQTNLQFICAVLDWAICEDLEFDIIDAAAALESRKIACEVFK